MSDHQRVSRADARNTPPLFDAVMREMEFLDAYGLTVSPIILDYAVHPKRSIAKHQDLVAAVVQALSLDGWTLAGTGFFSLVLVKGGLALKIGVKQDDTGAMYAAWCRANQGRAGVPDVYGITKFSGCYLVLMRRYDTFPEHLFTGDAPIPVLAEEFDSLCRALAGEAVGYYSDTVKTATEIGRFFKGVADFDLHEGNVMMDATGNFVLTDPISFGPCSSSCGSTGYSASGSYSGYSEATPNSDTY